MAAKKPSRNKTAPPPKAGQRDFAAVFAALRKVLLRLDDELAPQTDAPGNFHMAIPGTLHRGKPLYFGGVKTGRNYVSFHLMPVYCCPELLRKISPALRKRMQGKSCFNFTAIDGASLAELERLAAAGLKKFRSPKFLARIQLMQ